LVGRFWESRWLKIAAGVGWVAIVFRAGVHGTSFELLIMGNNNGNIFLLGGIVLVIIAAARRV